MCLLRGFWRLAVQRVAALTTAPWEAADAVPARHQEHLPWSKDGIFHPQSPQTCRYLGGQSCWWHFFCRPLGCVAGSQKEFLVAPLPLHTHWATCLCTPSRERHTKKGAVIPAGWGWTADIPRYTHPSAKMKRLIKQRSFGSDQSSSDILESTFLNVFVSLRKGSCRPSSRFKWLWSVLELPTDKRKHSSTRLFPASPSLPRCSFGRLFKENTNQSYRITLWLLKWIQLLRNFGTYFDWNWWLKKSYIF